MMEGKRTRKIIIVTAGLAFSIVALFFVGRYFLYQQIRKAIERELANLREQEIYVDYDQLVVHPWKGTLEVVQLRVKVRKDHPDKEGLDATIPYVLISGVELIPFLRNRTLSLDSIVAARPAITYARGATLFEFDSLKKSRMELRNIAVRHVTLPGIDLYVRDADAADTIAHLLSNIRMKDVFLHKQLDSITWQRGEVLITGLAMKSYPDQYGFSAPTIRFDIRKKSIDIDSFRVKPVLSKHAFMKFRGREDTYIDGFIPSFQISGANWFAHPRPAVIIDNITTTFYLDLYRDKRLPFLDWKEKKLPSHLLQCLPFELVIDTFRIRKSFVRYEEHPETGDAAGHVYFDNLFATIEKLHNTPKLQQDIRMTAKATFMGSGELNASFTFPYDTTRPYHARGSLTNMPLPDVNAMLTPAAQVRIQKGEMKKLTFNFSYGPVRSDGKLELHYENLKIQSLRTNSRNEQKISTIRTLLLNTFIIKKDMKEDAEEDERTGKISVYRDPRRAVFNYWWKSLLSGLKQAYNLDQFPVPGETGKKSHVAPTETKEKKKKKGIRDIFSKIFDNK